MLGERLGKWHFWVMLVGFNLTFGPMHILGLQGMMRRTFTYTEGQGFNLWNMVATIGAFTIAVALIIFMVNVYLSYMKHRREQVNPGPDPWDARSLEWMIPSPTPEHNFDETPVVEELDEFWHRKYGHDENGRLVRIAATEDVVQKGDATDVHLPSPSYWPLVMAVGFPLVGYGLIFNYWWAVPGALLIVLGIFGWVFEPSTDPNSGHGHHDDHPTDDHPDAAEVPEGGTGADGDDATVDGGGDGADERTPEPAMASTEETTVG
jgi:cytochrome c oxidase subunit 1